MKVKIGAGAFLASVMVPVAVFAAEPPDCADARTRTYVYPRRVVWQTQPEKAYGEPRFRVEKPELLLERKFGQVPEKGFWRRVGTRLVYEGDGIRPAILLDFGRELHGGVQLGVSCDAPRAMRVRLRFGESAGEAMCELGEKGSTNDHALRDLELAVPSNGSIEVGNTGFRFLRIDLVTAGSVGFDFIRAVELMRPMRRLGAFKCSDERLNRVFETSVRTAHLCCQETLWDGIKRDRLVWLGDSHPEFKVILGVFGPEPVLYETLDYVRAVTPPDREWMNGVPTYTLCYLRDEAELYRADGDRARLEGLRDYLVRTTKRVLSCMTPSNTWETGGWAFLDWPSQHDNAGTRAGINGAAALALGDAAGLMDVLDEAALAASCRDAVRRLRCFRGNPGECKQAGALLALGGIRDPKEMFATCLGRRGHAGVSTFYGYYMIEAMSAAGEQRRALDTVRDYWGAMNDMGATSYWENFDVAWTNGATRLDELPAPGRKDIHGDFGEFCYPGYRHSLCHGWASGPAAWCIERVLGLRLAEPGGTAVTFKPDLGGLVWAEGAIALPRGRRVSVRVERRPDGSYATQVDAPEGVRILQ